MQPNLRQLACYVETGRLRLENEGRDAPTACLKVRFGVDHHHIGNRPVGNKNFRAVDEIPSIHRACRRANAHGIGAGVRLGQRQRADCAGAGKPRQVFRVLVFSTVTQDIVGAQVQVGKIGDGNGDAGASNTAGHHCCHHDIAATASVFFGDGKAREALLTQLVPQPCGESIVAFHLGDMWANLFLPEPQRAFICKLVLLGEFKVHRYVPFL